MTTTARISGISLFILLPLLTPLLSPTPCRAQTSGYKIFGRVTTVDDRTVKGYITWGEGQMYWTDFFRAAKPDNPYARYFNGRGVSFPGSGTVPPAHAFACRFGEIKSIRQTIYDRIELQIKDGNIIELTKGGHEDIGIPLSIHAADEGTVILPWDKISKIEFMQADLPDSGKNGQPITGIVKTSQGIYKGFVSWDNNTKRTLDDSLDGNTSGGKKTIPFREIRQIVKTRNACKVVTKEGGELEMRETGSDVTVSMPNVGTVNIPWKHVEIFEATDEEEVHAPSYNDFPLPKRLYGQVKTKGGTTLRGILAFDLDEAMNFELLEGRNDHIFYEIPLRHVRRIEPKNYKYSLITLTNNGRVSLGEEEDVDARNCGVLLFSPRETPVYIPWQEIEEITFTH